MLERKRENDRAQSHGKALAHRRGFRIPGPAGGIGRVAMGSSRRFSGVGIRRDSDYVSGHRDLFIFFDFDPGSAAWLDTTSGVRSGVVINAAEVIAVLCCEGPRE